MAALGSSRRKFLKDTVKLTTALSISGAFCACYKPESEVTFGVITDIHQDLIPDAEDRLRAFINQSQSRKLDFIIQMGDFCIPKPENRAFVDLFNGYSGDKYHILGNHDTDGGFSGEQAMDFWTMRAKYYSFDYHGVHFVVLDGNDPNPQPFEGYNRFIGAEQLEWLRRDLSGTNFLTIIFTHQVPYITGKKLTI